MMSKKLSNPYAVSAVVDALHASIQIVKVHKSIAAPAVTTQSALFTEGPPPGTSPGATNALAATLFEDQKKYRRPLQGTRDRPIQSSSELTYFNCECMSRLSSCPLPRKNAKSNAKPQYVESIEGCEPTRDSIQAAFITNIELLTSS